MVRKKEFDPLGGSISYEKPIKAKKNNSILGSIGNTGSSSVYDKMDYSPVSHGWKDALTASGEPDKPKKRGLFSGIFGQKKPPTKPRPTKSEYDMDFEIRDEARTLDTKKHSHDGDNILQDYIFKEPDRPSFVTNVKDQHPTRRPAEEPQPKKQAMRYHPNICFLCGADSATPISSSKSGKLLIRKTPFPYVKPACVP